MARFLVIPPALLLGLVAIALNVATIEALQRLEVSADDFAKGDR
jgi:hypothetical protein